MCRFYGDTKDVLYFNQVKEKGLNMQHIKLWIITVNPKQGYGAPYYFIYQNGDNAMNKFQELINKYNLSIVGLLRNEAIAGDDGDHKHIDRIIIEPDYTCD